MVSQSEKLTHLVRLLWRSPIFGDSFPAGMNPSVGLADTLFPCFADKFLPILQIGLPESSPAEWNDILGQVAPKSLAFCASIAAGELPYTGQLCAAASAIAISYWADQSMDRGDRAMLGAVRYLNHENISDTLSGLPAFMARLNALRQIEEIACQLNDDPRDLPYVLQAIQRDVLGKQAEMRQMSQAFLRVAPAVFWNMYAQKIAQTMIDCSGLMSAVAIIYAIYRRHQPELPSLDEIYHQPALMSLVRGPFNAAVRVFDDAGDWRVDAGLEAGWGLFNLNLFNQSHPLLVEAFLDVCGLEFPAPLRAEAQALLTSTAESRRFDLAQFYLKFVRQRTAALPAPLWERYRVFLTLAKRTLEAGLVNALGDIFLAENTDASALESGWLSLLNVDSEEKLP